MLVWDQFIKKTSYVYLVIMINDSDLIKREKVVNYFLKKYKLFVVGNLTVSGISPLSVQVQLTKKLCLARVAL